MSCSLYKSNFINNGAISRHLNGQSSENMSQIDDESSLIFLENKKLMIRLLQIPNEIENFQMNQEIMKHIFILCDMHVDFIYLIPNTKEMVNLIYQIVINENDIYCVKFIYYLILQRCDISLYLCSFDNYYIIQKIFNNVLNYQGENEQIFQISIETIVELHEENTYFKNLMEKLCEFDILQANRTFLNKFIQSNNYDMIYYLLKLNKVYYSYYKENQLELLHQIIFFIQKNLDQTYSDIDNLFLDFFILLSKSDFDAFSNNIFFYQLMSKYMGKYKNANSFMELIISELSIIVEKLDDMTENFGIVLIDFLYETIQKFKGKNLTSKTNYTRIENILEVIVNLSTFTGTITDLMIQKNGFMETIISLLDESSFSIKFYICIILSNFLFEGSFYFNEFINRINIPYVIELLYPLLFSNQTDIQKLVFRLIFNILDNCDRYNHKELQTTILAILNIDEINDNLLSATSDIEIMVKMKELNDRISENKGIYSNFYY